MFLTLRVCFYLNEMLHIYLESAEDVIHDLALWPLTMSYSFCRPWMVCRNSAIMLFIAYMLAVEINPLERNKDTVWTFTIRCNGVIAHEQQ